MKYSPPNIIPEYSSYAGSGYVPVTMNDMMNYINNPLERERLKYYNAISADKELDLRIMETMRKNNQLPEQQTLPKTKIIKNLPYYGENKTDISFMYGAGNSVKGVIEDDKQGVSEFKIHIQLEEETKSSVPLIEVKQGDCVYSNDLQYSNYTFNEEQMIQESLSVVVTPPQGFIRNGILTPYDENGVNVCIQYHENNTTNPYEHTGLLGSESNSVSLFGPSQSVLSMSPGYNGTYDPYGYLSGGSGSGNYLGYGSNPYTSNNYGIYGIYGNGISPYYIQQQQDALKQQQLQQQRMEQGIEKKLYSLSCSMNNEEVDQDYLSQIDGTYYNDILDDLTSEERAEYEAIKRREEEFKRNYARLSYLESQPYYVNQSAIAWSNVYCNYIDKAKQEIPDNVGMVEFFNKYAGKKLAEAYDMKSKEKDMSDMKALCNPEVYNKALEDKRIELHADSQDVYLPMGSNGITMSASDEQKRLRRKMFMDAILKNRTVD